MQLPAGAPREIVAQLQAAAAKALREPDMLERFTMLGMELQENGTEHYSRFLREDIDRYGAAVRDGGIRAN
jgi:tripartite-type tricarboxylate transporter receptor subunit TctC